MKGKMLPAKKTYHAGAPTRRNALLVDGDMDALLYCSAILQDEGYQVRTLASYDEKAQSFDLEDFDLVIVSQGTEAFEGCYVLNQEFERNHDIPVLVLTRGQKADDRNCEGMPIGAFPYHEKTLVASDWLE